MERRRTSPKSAIADLGNSNCRSRVNPRSVRGMVGFALMTVKNDPSSTIGSGGWKSSLRRLAPLLAIGCLSIVVIAMGWEREISFESLARHHDVLRKFIAAHEASALAAYIALYIAVVGLSLPVGA